MLYKEAPAPQPQGPGQTGFICVNPPPEQPVPGQNTAYQYGYSGQTVGQAPGRTSFGGQTAGQPNYGGQGQQGQSGGGGGKKKTPILIGGIAAAAVVLIAAVIIVMNGRNPDPTISFAPSSQAPETPGQSHSLPPVEPVLDIIPGVTEDGFRYEIIDHRYAVLTGYEGNGDAGYMPDYVELAGYKENGYAQAMWEEPDDAGRSIPVTKIADNAFAGAPMSNGTLILPLELETIGANAFRGCGDLIAVGAYSDVTTESTSFSGCDNLWFVFSYADNISGWDLPGGVRLFYAGMDTGIGPLEDLDAINDDQLFGVTEDGTRVLLDVLPQTTYIDLEDTGWICPWALDNLEYGATIDLGEDTLYPYEAFGSSYSWYAPDYTLSDMWLLTCVTADAINAARPSGAPRIEPDEDLMRAAMLGAEEYTEPHDIDYRDKAADKRWDTILDERAVRNSWCAWAAGYDYSDYQNMWEKASDYTTENYASAIAKGDYTGQYYSRIGMAAFQQPDGTYTWWGFVIIP